MNRILLLFSLMFMVTLNHTYAQTFEINTETVITCGGTFQDDNGGIGDAPGAEGSPYSGEDYIFTICPDTPGDVIQVDFLAFSLYTSPNPNNSDYLAIFDGDSPAANSMGSYTGSSLTGIPVTGTVNNISGCLTFVFNPSNSSTGTFPGWEGLISCTTPCAPPTAASTISDPAPDENNSVSVCLNTPITFEDNGSFAAVGFTLENYIWNFDDGTVLEGSDLTSVEHAFNEPGEYIVTLTVADNNGCQNLNLQPLQILVSTIPTFNTNFTEEICLGGTGFIDGSPVQSATWTALPPQVVAGETYLADGAGFSYTSSLLFDFFEEDQVLETIDDLLNISINMEHSYMGDLQIQIACPDGSQVVLLEFPNTGGGTNLGVAIDDGSIDPGEGYDYYWDPEATNGTWEENAAGGSLPSGTYESEFPLTDLVGCPLNGEWTIEVIDNLAIDNGYIFEWGVNLNPELFPGVTTFTPTIGLGLDSTWVEGEFIDELSVDGNYAEITPPALGDYDYTFYAANNFGCTFDTTIVVTVVPGPELILPEEIGFCGDEFELVPEITNEFDQGPCMFSVVLANDQGNGFNDSSVEIYFDGVLSQTISSFTDEQEFLFPVPTGTTLSLTYVESFWGEMPGNIVSLFDDAGNELFVSDTSPNVGEIFSETVFCSGPGQLQFEWLPATGLDSPNAPVTAGQNNVPTTYTLTTFPEGYEGCATSAEVFVFPQTIPDLGEDTEITICLDAAEFEMIDALEGNPEEVAIWYDSNSNEVSEFFNPAEDPQGTYTYRWTGQDCPTIETDLIINIDELVLSVTSDTTICQNGTANLGVELNGTPTGDIFVLWNGGIFEGENIDVQPMSSPMLYQVQAEYGDGCFSNLEEVVVTTAAPLEMSGLIDEQICLGDSVLKSPINPTGGLEPYNFTWSGGDLSGSANQVVLSPTETTTYCLEMTDACESDAYSICFDILLNDIISALFNATGNTGCFPINTEFSGTAEDLNIVESMVWDFGDGTSANTLNFASHNYTSPGVYDVSLTITGTDGCIYENTEEALVSAYNVPEAQFTLDNINVVLPDNDFQFENFSTDNDFNEWTFDEFGESTEENPTFETDFEEPQEFNIQLVVGNNEGCTDTITRTVYLVDGFSLYAPTGFTPDGDGLNDVWKIEGIDIDESDFTLNIWNRFGNLVFQTLDPNDFWNGSYQNGEHFVPNGVYTFQVLTRAKTSGDKKEITGMITIFR